MDKIKNPKVHAKGTQQKQIAKKPQAKNFNPRGTAKARIVLTSQTETDKVPNIQRSLSQKREEFLNLINSKQAGNEIISFIQTEEIHHTKNSSFENSKELHTEQNKPLSPVFPKTERPTPSQRAAIFFDKDKMEIHGDIEACTSRRDKLSPCLICFDKAPDAVFMECGHGGILVE